MLPRTLDVTIDRASETFPTIVVTGPRQAGKTTLLRLGRERSHAYVSLEDPDVRARVQADPRGTLDALDGPVVLDEIQYVPELLSYVKTRIDADRRPGWWLLTGSQGFGRMEGVSQSLTAQHDPGAMRHGPMFGALVETAVVSAWVKAFVHRGEPPALYFWRTRDGLEVDLLIERNGRL